MSGPAWWQVLHFDGGPLRRAADGWRWLADRLQRHAEALAPLPRAAEQAWDGPAARMATHRLRQLRDTVEAARLPLRGQQHALSDLAEAGERLRNHAHDLAARARAAGLAIAPDGTVAPAGVDAEFAARAVAVVRHQVREVLDEAARLDAELRRRIHEHPPLPPGWMHRRVPPGAVPARGTDPAQVHRWWRGLDPAQRAYLLARHPELLGPLDGVPVLVRDRANRAVLARERERLERERDALVPLVRPHPGGNPAAVAPSIQLRRIRRLLEGLDLVEQWLRRPGRGGQQRHLLALDTAGDGKMVLALGNPDRADNVLTYVPGTGSAPDRAGGDLRRLATMAGDAAAAAPDAETAAVYWLGYDAPDSLLQAAGRGAAEGAAGALRRYGDGLDATHSGGGARHTVLGHSYGSTVIGQTAVDGLAADALVFVGSPGVVAESASDLHIDGDPAEDVWSATAVTDPIHLARPAAVFRLASLASPPGQRLAGAFLPTTMVHGTDPGAARFGGQTIAADWHGGHGGYWEDGNPARDHIARITTGAS